MFAMAKTISRTSESYIAVKGQTLILTKSESKKRGLSRRPSAVTLSSSPPDSQRNVEAVDEQNFIFNCASERQTMSEIERNLHQMTQLLRQEDSIKLVVRLESVFASRIRYLAVVSCIEQETEEFCLLGIDCQGEISLGLVLAILSHTTIRLDGDGGFCVTDGDCLRSHIFKPVSVQTMWSALQSLYRASECAKKNNSYQVSAVKHYETLFNDNKSDTGCLNEWNLIPGIENRRPVLSNLSLDERSFQKKISSALREILLCERDLDEVTSKEIRTKLETKLQVDLSNYKSFIDEEMFTILGQMEAPAMISDHLFLGTEWNASHQQDLFDKGIGCILNVTAEIDNFFPDNFRYMNIPVSDNEETDLLRYFNDSYRFITEAHKEGKNVLVHCKMGISRSATIVIAYVMKERNWNLHNSIKHVTEKRNCVKPNPNFMKQLEVYEGILSAKRFSNTLEKRSKSESNLKRNDLSLPTRKDPNLSNSNDNIGHSVIMSVKSQKMYYNTAPARLRPEKEEMIEISVSKARSSSCAIIPPNQQMGKYEKLDEEILPREIMDSFKNAFESLQQSSQINSPKHPFNTQQRSTSTREWESIVISQNAMSSNELEKTGTYVTTERFVFEEEKSFEVPSEQPETVETREMITYGTEDPTPLFFHSNELTEDPNRESKKMNLKCCRRPFNGHTFSVSPNQVVNISSIDYSKFSVRHLVNEFEQQNSRKSSLILDPGFSSPNNSMADPPTISWTKGHWKSKGDVEKKETNGRVDKTPREDSLYEFRRVCGVRPNFEPVVGPKVGKVSEKDGSLGKLLKHSKKSSEGRRCRGFDRSVKGKQNKAESPRENLLSLINHHHQTEGRRSSNLPTANVFPSTGVVKQRLEVFEAKSVPGTWEGTELTPRSHNRSQSATGPSCGSNLPPDPPMAHRRKSSMPQLPTEGEGGAGPSFRPAFIQQSQERKGSLDSNNLKTGTKAMSRPLTVRGLQHSVAKGSSRLGNHVGGSNTRQQHGSTHPLNLLPQSTKLSHNHDH